MLQSSKILEIVKTLEPKLIADRRHLHINAEVSGKEYETAAYIVSEMQKLGLKPVWVRERVSPYFLFDTGKKGKTLVFRADIDALEVQEDACNLKQKKVAVSKNDGVCHACAHDGHTAILLAVARAIVENADDFCGRFIFFFESAEEDGKGTSEEFSEILKEIKPDGIWGIHLCSFMDCGKISVQAGPRMAASGKYKIEITGRGGHGSTPHKSINPLNAAAELVCKMQSIIPTKLPVGEIATLAVTEIKGGETWNIIPDTCIVSGNYRCCSQQVYNMMSSQIRLICDSVCQANDCTPNYIIFPNNEDAGLVINDPNVSAIAETALDKILPGSRHDEPVWMASEPFGKYQKIVPGVFAFVGVRNDEFGSGAAHHNSKFDIDEKSLSLSVAATLQFASDFVSE